MIVGGYGARHAERIDIADLVDIYGAVDTAAIRVVGGDNRRYLQACGIESLARGDTCHRPAHKLLGQSAVRGIFISLIYKLAMNLVADHNHIIVAAYPGNAQQLVAAPHTSGRIGRIAQKQYLRLGVGGLGGEVVKVDEIAVAGIDERVLKHGAAIVAYRGEEAVVDRRLHYHLVAGLGESLDNSRDSRHHTTGIHNAAALDLPAMAAAKPIDYSPVVIFAHKCVAESPLAHTALKSLNYSRRRGKVHVGHPQGQHIGLGVPLVASGAAALHAFVEKCAIVSHQSQSCSRPGRGCCRQ